MQITLYKTGSERNALNKVLTNPVEFNGTLRNETSISDPIITLEYSSNITGYNYCYISEFERYYFINDIRSVRNNLWALHMHVDVLMSFKSSILASTVILAESTDTGKSNYLVNDVWVSTVKDKTDIINFSSGLLESGEYILITAGG